MKLFVELSIIFVFIAIFLTIFTIAMRENDKQNCITWRAQAEEYDNYFILEWQKQQCDLYGIIISAPVVPNKR